MLLLQDPSANICYLKILYFKNIFIEKAELNECDARAREFVAKFFHAPDSKPGKKFPPLQNLCDPSEEPAPRFENRWSMLSLSVSLEVPLMTSSRVCGPPTRQIQG